MSEQLFIASYKVLDDPQTPEDQRVDRIEALTQETFPQLTSDEVERLVLGVLMAHHRGKTPAEAARTQKIKTTSSSSFIDAVPGDQVSSGQVSSGSGAARPAAGLPADAVPKRDATPFDQLREVFGASNSDSDIERVLAHNDFDFGRTLDLLAGEQASLELSKEQTAARIMCRYYITGKCMRGDQCMYSHDGSQRICRFWLHQRCHAGDNCIFMHGLPRLPEKYRRRTVQPAPISLNALQSLPSLGDKRAGRAGPAPVFAGTHESGPASLNLAPISEVLGELNTGLVPLAKPRLTPWAVPEFGANRAYVEHRDAANAHADQRNKQLQQSTKAWSSNNSGQAKELSARGRAHEQEMIAHNRAAADLLWEQRQMPGSEIWIDLHGQDFTDAMEDLRTKLDTVARTERHQPRCVYVNSGRGHYYAKRYTDQMTQYVRALLDTEGYKHRDLGVAPQYGRITVVDPFSKMRDIKDN